MARRFERHVLHHRPVLIPQLGKARIDIVVEDITLKQRNDLGRPVNADGFF